jgi:hypothetical protein
VVGGAPGHVPEWKQFRDLSDQTRRQLVDLEAELAAAAPTDADSDEWAPEAWRRVERALTGDR